MAKSVPVRPTLFTQVVADEICRRLAAGSSLVRICRSTKMPLRQTVYDWLRERPAFADSYARAREAFADQVAEECVAIADSVPRRASHEQISAAKLRIDARKWTAARMAPKRWGVKTQTEVTATVRHGIDRTAYQALLADPKARDAVGTLLDAVAAPTPPA